MSRPVQRRAMDYHRLTVRDKQRVQLERMRPPAVRCPDCDTETTAADLVAHIERCPGPREPHPLERWITWREARQLGVLPGTMSRWVNRGEVRAQEGTGERRYLLRDVVTRMADRRRWLDRRREFPRGNRSAR